jgi:uncharacterized membrane protein
VGSALGRRRARARQLCLITSVLLLVLLSVGTLSIVNLDLTARMVLLVAQALPLLGFLPALWRGGYRAYLWLCFVLLMYFVMATVRVVAAEAVMAQYLELMCTVVLFCAAMLYGRWRAQEILLDDNSANAGTTPGREQRALVTD